MPDILLRHNGVCCVLAIWLLTLDTPSARTLEVGPQRDLQNPSEAAKIVHDGDRVAIDPGEYFDCAVWHANGITIEAADPAGAVLTDRACAGKASFVVTGNDIILHGLTFTRIRVPDGNGAGVRAEGRNLTVEHCRFINNQMAILTVSQPAGSLVVRDSEFIDNGACTQGHCTGAIATGMLARLRIERSRFQDPRGSQPGDGEAAAGPQIASAALITEILDNSIEDGNGASSFLVTFNANGALTMNGNFLEKGPRPAAQHAAILAAGTGWGNAERLVARHNTLVNHTGRPAVFLLNWTGTRPELDQNDIADTDIAVSSRGIWRHRARYVLDELIGAKDTVRHFLGGLLRGRVFG